MDISKPICAFFCQDGYIQTVMVFRNHGWVEKNSLIIGALSES
jgi:hypothetical protein